MDITVILTLIGIVVAIVIGAWQILLAQKQIHVSKEDKGVGASHPTTPKPQPLLSFEPPYKGLQYFDYDDAKLFFGRETLTTKIVSQLRTHPFLAIIGASGSGKSSLIRAGIAAALWQSNQELASKVSPSEKKADWQIYITSPDIHPIEALATTLTRDSERVIATAMLIDDLRKNTSTLYYAIRKLLNKANSSRLLLVIDQFEELFTLCRDETERRAFVDNLMYAVMSQDDKKANIVIVFRADFYAFLAQYPALREAVAQHQEYIGPMTRDELRRAIEEPAKQGNWGIEKGLVELMLSDMGDEPGALPLLSHALLETWKRQDKGSLTLQGYTEAGGVRGAIARTADEAYNELSFDEQGVARRIFLSLTEPGDSTPDTRRPAKLDELMRSSKNASMARSVLKRLADARLIVTDKDSAEVAHEALIREWPVLRKWLAEERDSLLLHRHLSDAAQAWERLNHDSSELYRGTRLSKAITWANDHATEISSLELQFLNASRELAEREKAERALTVMHGDKQRMLAEAQEKANRKLARDLHDGPVQAVAALAMRSNFARRLLERDPKIAGEELVKMEDLARKTTKEIRHMLFTLRPLVLESQGLASALQQLAEKMRNTHSQNVIVEVDPQVDNQLELTWQGVLFYIAEEAVNNARKHAQAQHIWVRVKLKVDILNMEIEDDGVGFNVGKVNADYDKLGSYGLVNMRERVEMLDGLLKVDSTTGKGTRISIFVPTNLAK